jgi:hypothetical protein
MRSGSDGCGASDHSDKNKKWPDGAVWVFTRTAGVWTQQGPKLVGSGAVGHASQGISVALSADGNTAMVGYPQMMRLRGLPGWSRAELGFGAS